MSFSRIRSRFRRVDSGGSGQGNILGVGSPTDIHGLAFWVRSDLGVTIVMGPVVAAGTTPPAVTLTGTPSNTVNTIEIDITAPGTLGVAVFSWKLNGVVQQTLQVTSASFVLGTTGITAQFPAGTYTADNVYTAVIAVSSWADQSGGGNNVVQATSGEQPGYSISGGPNGTAALTFVSASSQSLKVSYTDNQPCERYVVCKPITGGGSNQRLIDGANGNSCCFIIQTTSFQIYSGSTQVSYTGTLGNWVALGGLFSNSASDFISQNGIVKASGNPGTNNAGGMTVGDNGSGGNPFQGSIAEVIEYGGPGFTGLTTNQRTALEKYFNARYGT